MPQIARLKIQLDDMERPVARRVEVPSTIGLNELHLVIQIVMGWKNDHLYEFRVGRDLIWSFPDPDWPLLRSRDAEQETLADLLAHLKRNKTFHYLYDFGDSWLHTVKVEAVAAADPEVDYPRLLDAEGACPPEDCGGTWGYAHYLEAIADPSHEDHHDMIERRGPGFDPSAVDEAAIRKKLSALAPRRRRKPKAAQ
jgi:hypothetical protein